MSSNNFSDGTSNFNRPLSGAELLKEKNKEATCKYTAGNDGKKLKRHYIYKYIHLFQKELKVCNMMKNICCFI